MWVFIALSRSCVDSSSSSRWTFTSFAWRNRWSPTSSFFPFGPKYSHLEGRQTLQSPIFCFSHSVNTSSQQSVSPICPELPQTWLSPECVFLKKKKNRVLEISPLWCHKGPCWSLSKVSDRAPCYVLAQTIETASFLPPCIWKVHQRLQ